MDVKDLTSCVPLNDIVPISIPFTTNATELQNVKDIVPVVSVTNVIKLHDVKDIVTVTVASGINEMELQDVKTAGSEAGTDAVVNVNSGIQTMSPASRIEIHDNENAQKEMCHDRVVASTSAPSNNVWTNDVIIDCKGSFTKEERNTLDTKNDFSCEITNDIQSPVLIHESLDFSSSKVKHAGDGMENIACANRLKIDSIDRNINYDVNDARKKVIIIGAGPAGLTAARHLQHQGFSVILLEARDRIGGRVYTDHSSLSVPVDLGASIITGVEADIATQRRADPSSLICKQLGIELTVLNSDCPLYDIVTGQKVPSELDEALEAEYNNLLDNMDILISQNGDVIGMSLEEGLEFALKKCHMTKSTSLVPISSKMVDKTKSLEFPGNTSNIIQNDLHIEMEDKNGVVEDILSPIERRVMDWHFAHLEYGCAAPLKDVSLLHWNQDDVYGGFGGAHCMVKGGFSNITETLGKGLTVHLNHVVTEIMYNSKETSTGSKKNEVKVSTSGGSQFVGDMVLVTVPLGCLKANSIKFSPALPDWKQTSIQRLGFGILNKVVLEFSEVFWDDNVDYFGATAEETCHRGQYFMFWNVKKTVGAPVLIALVAGRAAVEGQDTSTSDHVSQALMILRKLFSEKYVPDPVASIVTNWGMDPFSKGAYSYVAVGASGEDYDILGRPVANCVFFAGEATCKEYPDTVGGAMLSGLREAVRIIDIFRTGNDYISEAEAMAAAQRQAESKRNEVRDFIKRLDTFKLSNGLVRNSFGSISPLFTKDILLQDMFCNAKTTAGRLHLAKELLHLPVESLKSFYGTKEGLAILNSWIRVS